MRTGRTLLPAAMSHYDALASASSTECIADKLKLDRSHLQTLSAADRVAMVTAALDTHGMDAVEQVAEGRGTLTVAGRLAAVHLTTKTVSTSSRASGGSGRSSVSVPIPEDPSHPLNRSVSLHERIMESHGAPTACPRARAAAAADSLPPLRLPQPT